LELPEKQETGMKSYRLSTTRYPKNTLLLSALILADMNPDNLRVNQKPAQVVRKKRTRNNMQNSKDALDLTVDKTKQIVRENG